MTWSEVAERVWVRVYDPFTVNVTAIDVGGALVVVDTRGSGVEGRELADHLAELPTSRVAAVVNTHHHFDHTFGNEAFAAAPRWAHDRCGDLLLARVHGDTEDLESVLPQALHQPLRDTNIVAPDHLFASEAVLEVGERRVLLHHLGRAHTDNDIVVVVPDARLVVAGDLIEQIGPPMYEDGYPMAWPDTVGALLELGAAIHVPGHGEPVDRAFVERQRGEIAEVAELARRYVEEGATLEELTLHATYPADVVATACDRAVFELVRGTWPWSRWEHEGWSVELPVPLIRQPNVRPAPDSDLLAMALARGWLDDTPASIVIATAPSTGPVRDRTERTATSLDQVEQHAAVKVPGASAAARVDGEWVFEEALTPSGHERLTQVVADDGTRHVSLSVRIPRAATHLHDVVERIAASFAIG